MIEDIRAFFDQSSLVHPPSLELGTDKQAVYTARLVKEKFGHENLSALTLKLIDAISHFPIGSELLAGVKESHVIEGHWLASNYEVGKLFENLVLSSQDYDIPNVSKSEGTTGLDYIQAMVRSSFVSRPRGNALASEPFLKKKVREQESATISKLKEAKVYPIPYFVLPNIDQQETLRFPGEPAPVELPPYQERLQKVVDRLIERQQNVDSFKLLATDSVLRKICIQNVLLSDGFISFDNKQFESLSTKAAEIVFSYSQKLADMICDHDRVTDESLREVVLGHCFNSLIMSKSERLYFDRPNSINPTLLFEEMNYDIMNALKVIKKADEQEMSLLRKKATALVKHVEERLDDNVLDIVKRLKKFTLLERLKLLLSKNYFWADQVKKTVDELIDLL